MRHGYEDREAHINAMLHEHGIPFEYMLRGDIADLDKGLAERFLAPAIGIPRAAQSCAVKHLLIYEEIVRRDLPGALVLEDDIVFLPRFDKIFEQSMRELPRYDAGGTAPVLISYEDTRLRFVERSRREKGRVLYPGDRDRMAGCYYINRAAAALILDTLRAEGGLTMPIDLYHNELLRPRRAAISLVPAHHRPPGKPQRHVPLGPQRHQDPHRRAEMEAPLLVSPPPLFPPLTATDQCAPGPDGSAFLFAVFSKNDLPQR